MPYIFELDSQLRVAFVRGFGPMDLAETLEAPAVLSRHVGFRPDFGVIADLRALEYEPAADDVVAVARNLIGLRHNFTSRVAVVVPRRLSLAAEIGAAMAGAGGFALRIFESLDEAMAWVVSPR